MCIFHIYLSYILFRIAINAGLKNPLEKSDFANDYRISRDRSRILFELYKPIKMQEFDERQRLNFISSHAREHARMFPKSINMLIRLLPRKLNARRRQGLKGILIQGHRD